MTFTEAAVLILRAEGKPLTWRKLAELAVRHDLLSHVGTDPTETMRVRLSDVVRRQGGDAPFVEGKGGNYSLREWKGTAPGPSAEAAAELEARHVAAAAVPVPAAPPPASAGAGRRRTRGGSVGEKRAGKRGTRSRATPRPAHAAATEDDGVSTTGAEGPQAAEGIAAEAARELPEAEGAAPDAGSATGGSTEPGRPAEGRKRRRRGRRGRGGLAQPAAEQPPEVAPPMPASPVAAAEPFAAAPAPAAPPPPAPVPSEAYDRPAQPSPAAAPERPVRPPQPAMPERSARPPAPPATAAPCAPCELARAAESALRLLRGIGGRRPLRVAEILGQWTSRGVAEGRLPPAVLTAALASADAMARVGAPLVALSGGRWAPTEWVWGDESAAQERRIGEAVGQYLAALRRVMLRRLADMPLPAFQQIVVALLAAEGFRDVRPLEDGGNAGGDQLLLRGRMPYGPAEIPMIILVVRGAPGRFVAEDQVVVLRGRLPHTGACGGAIVTLGRVSDVARRDLVPPNAIPLLAIEHEALAERLVARRIGVRPRCLELPALDPDVFGGFGEP